MEAAETHCYSVISIQSVVPTGKQTDVVGDMQDAAWQETHNKDDENKSADPDKRFPVATGLS